MLGGNVSLGKLGPLGELPVLEIEEFFGRGCWVFTTILFELFILLHQQFDFGVVVSVTTDSSTVNNSR